jgi:hypothetical protein
MHRRVAEFIPSAVVPVVQISSRSTGLLQPGEGPELKYDGDILPIGTRKRKTQRIKQAPKADGEGASRFLMSTCRFFLTFFFFCLDIPVVRCLLPLDCQGSYWTKFMEGKCTEDTSKFFFQLNIKSVRVNLRDVQLN